MGLATFHFKNYDEISYPIFSLFYFILNLKVDSIIRFLINFIYLFINELARTAYLAFEALPKKSVEWSLLSDETKDE